MTINMKRQSPYLRDSRNYPPDLKELATELDKTYIDVANAVNNRTVGNYPVNFSIFNGENWYLTSPNKKNEALRQVFLFDDSSLTITHNINLTGIVYFTRIWGVFYDGTYWNPLPYIDVTGVTNQVNVKVSSTQIIVTKGGGSPPTISNGIIVVEWLSPT